MKSSEIVARTDELFKELKKYPANSKEYRAIESEIVKINRQLVIYLAKRHFPFMGPAFSADDLISECCVALVRAVRSFKPEKQITFSTYARRCIKNKIIYCLQRESKNIEASSLETYVGDELKLEDVLTSPDNMEEEIADKDEIQRQMAWVKNHLDQLAPLQKQVIISKYLSNEASSVTYTSLGKKLNCSRQNITDADKGAVKKLRKIFYKAYPEEIELTREDNSKSGKKLSTLREGTQGSEHLKGVSANIKTAM